MAAPTHPKYPLKKAKYSPHLTLARSARMHWLYTEVREFSRWEAFEWLLFEANYSPADRFLDLQIIRVPRGSLITNQYSLAETFGWSRGRVERFLRCLQTERLIELKPSNRHTLLSIINFDSWLGVITPSEQQTELPAELPVSSQQSKNGTGPEPQSDTQQSHLISIELETNKQTTSLKKKCKYVSIFDVDELELSPLYDQAPVREALKSWITYKIECSKPLPTSSLKALVTSLTKSNPSPELFCYAIEHAISKGWAGVNLWPQVIEAFSGNAAATASPKKNWKQATKKLEEKPHDAR